jgi:hypothetical protein
LNIRRLLGPLMVAAIAAYAGHASAQGAFPAPLPNQQGFIPNDPAFPSVNGGAPANGAPRGAVRNDPAFPPVNGAAPTAEVGAPPNASFPVNGAAPIMGGGGGLAGPAPAPQQAGAADACMKQFMPLRQEAERRGKLIKAASDRKAPPAEACKLIERFGQAELKMIKYVETHAAKCGIPPQIADQLKEGHKHTEVLQKKVCAVAQQVQARGPAGPTLSEVLGSSVSAPEATRTKKGGSTFDTLNGNVLER